jgi:succinate dehydrogenase flavin-adding protein (antitoxin of CptAB toxin-antitoxin module)
MPFYMNQSLLLQQPQKNDFIELINYSGDDTFNLITQNLIPNQSNKLLH